MEPVSPSLVANFHQAGFSSAVIDIISLSASEWRSRDVVQQGPWRGPD
jgi:hypothetical protein